MLKEIRDSFRSLLNIILWLLLIASVLYGIRFGYDEGHLLLFPNDEKEHPIIGAFVFGIAGLILGYILLVIIFGWITTLLNIDENLQKITPEIIKWLSSVSKTTGIKDGFLYDKDYLCLADNKWICRKCGTANKLTRIGTIIESADDCTNCGRKLDIDEINLGFDLLDL